MPTPGARVTTAWHAVGVSLTSHLRSRLSPVRKFMLDRFGRTHPVVVPDPTFVADGPVIRLLPVSAGEPVVRPAISAGHPWSLVGAAIDYRIRLFMQCTDPGRLVASHGAVVLRALFGIAPVAFAELSEELCGLVAVGSRTNGLLEEEAERELLKDCFVLAMYESCFRTMPQPSWPIVQAGANAPLSVLKELCSPAALDDLLALARLAAERAESLFSGSKMVMNPTFASSVLLGGADADFIVDGCLYDIKTTVDKSPGREGLWQVVGYALADTDNAFGIRQLGFYFARQGVVLRWPLQGLLNSLGEREVDLAEERAAFRELLEGLQEKRLRTIRDPPTVPPAGPFFMSVRKVERPLPFYPKVGGRGGKRHAAVADANSSRLSDEPELSGKPACGSPGELDTTASPVVLVVGQRVDDVDSALCRRCLVFSDSFFARWEKPHHATTFRPGLTGTKWHLAAVDVVPRYFVGATHATCSERIDLDFAGESLTPDRATAISEPRLCKHCVREFLRQSE